MSTDLEALIGTHVEGVTIGKDRALVLQFSAAKPVRIPDPWTFTSCLMSVSSSDYDPEAGDLIGLEGAQLTGIESGQDRVELLLDSIRITARQ